MVTIRVAENADAELVEAYQRLIPQLSSSSPAPSEDELAAIIESDSATVLVAEDEGGTILGSMTLVVFRIPTGVRAWIEDVVVDTEARGMGIGQALNEYAINLAEQAGAKTIDLTSRPSRESANRLYKRLGFVARETNVYRYSIV
ncbi:MAG: GNAT family N-acetyltransferase [Acidimicrobiaceae bacterium]|jgi:ribosomal protein S18 acetylase RimI-like enzyme|nr:GNAT family N-acetyltransferase [Acidimicrobiaceae bacterium]HAY51267.1 GNAT family N-acetyltransferase [Acidimicrobiaceae bacterium]|tara:strand:+ start:456 stop:890 length:435 start_codon:yes stop_codon:yes gene_type:complete